ncbi:MAG: DUF5916 domain-containing protein [bacterium]
MVIRRAVTVMSLILLTTVLGWTNPSHVLVIEPIDHVEIDGNIETTWTTVPPLDHFTQIRPSEGSPAQAETFAYVRYTPDALLLAFDCRDPNPDAISGRIQRRDQDDNSDYIVVFFDPFHDQRSGYFFGVTAGGVQLDGTVSEESNFDDSWDGIWESAVRRTENGWTAEMRIPFSSFRHGNDNAKSNTWGLNFERYVHHLNEESHWRPQSRALGHRASQWGEMKGLQGIKGGAHVELLPHAVARWDAPDGSSVYSDRNSWDNLGLDLKIVPSPYWTMDVTFQPDFAQVDVDEEVTNLSDYPIYLDEKRPFFLEGLDLFSETEFQMLYTRKITDPDVGSRVTGQWGKFRGSALAVRDIGEGGEIRAVSAARGVLNFGKTSTAGFTSTTLSVDSGFHANAGDLDTHIRWGKENEWNTIFAAVDRTDSKQQPAALSSVILLFDEKHIHLGTGIHYLGRDFNVNDLGFTGYTNRMDQWFWTQYMLNPKTGLIESWWFNLNFYQEAMPIGYGLYERSGNWNTDVDLRSNWELYSGMAWGTGWFRERSQMDSTVAWDPKYADNFGPFYPEFHPYYSQWFGFETDDRKPVSLDLHLERSTFREGKEHRVIPELGWRPAPNMEITGAWDWTRIEDAKRVNDGARSDFTITRLRVRWSPTLDFSVRATIQMVHEDKRVNSNILFAWNWAPGSWAYLVYDEGRPTDDRFGYTRADRTIRLKWTWFKAVR